MRLFHVRLKGLLLAALGWVGSSAHGASNDPQLTWRTVHTEHFRIHFHQGEEQLVGEFAEMVERVYDEMVVELAWTPRMKTDLVLVDKTDRANGYATAVPYNSITIFVTAPQEDSTLALYEDWSEAIFTHELTHVLHMESHHGIVSVARAVVGRIASTQILSPRWIIEGFATFQETRQSAGGRGRSPTVDMIKRTSVVEDTFPPLGNMDGYQARLPAGNLRYLFGEDFIRYISQQVGEDVWTTWMHQYAGHIPYLLPSKKVFGRTLWAWHKDWKRAVHDRYETELTAVRTLGIREGWPISPQGQSCNSPSFAPTGDRLVFSCVDPKTGSSIWAADAQGGGAEVLIKDFGARNFTWTSDGEAFIYAATHVVNRFNTWSDLFRYDLSKRSIKPLTTGARARDPDLNPDGTKLWMVTNRAQNTQLEVLTVDGRREVLTDQIHHRQYATPRHSPDGQHIVSSVWEAGRRDLWLLDQQGRRIGQLTHDTANDRDPTWSPDSRYLVFASDRTGIPNIFAVDMQTRRLYQITNVTTGAARPHISADGLRLAYARYRTDGWQVHMMPFDPDQWIDRGDLPTDFTLPERGPVDPAAPQGEASFHAPDLKRSPFALSTSAAWAQDSSSVDTLEQAQVKDAYGEESEVDPSLHPKRYNPLRYLLPRYWVPTLELTPRLIDPPTDPVFGFLSRLPPPFDVWGISVGAATSASDPLGYLGWSANASYRTDARAFGGGGSFTLNRWLHVWTASVQTNAFPRFYRLTDPTSEPDDPQPSNELQQLFERRTTARLLMTYPFTNKSTVFGSYEYSRRTRLTDVSPDAYEGSLPLQGVLARLAAGYRYAWSQPTAYAISPEDGTVVNAVVGLVAPWLGAYSEGLDGERDGFFQFQGTFEGRGYVVNPWVPNHVLALRGAVGFGVGSDQFVGNFQLGGTRSDGSGYVRPPEYRMIRGYPFGAQTGDIYWLTGAEYRLPIWRFDTGLGTVPLFLRALHFAAFVDAGHAFNDADDVADVFRGSLVGVGGELRLSSVIGWTSSFQFRVGYAVGLTANGYGPTQPQAWYFQLGSSF